MGFPRKIAICASEARTVPNPATGQSMMLVCGTVNETGSFTRLKSFPAAWAVSCLSRRPSEFGQTRLQWVQTFPAIANEYLNNCQSRSPSPLCERQVRLSSLTQSVHIQKPPRIPVSHVGFNHLYLRHGQVFGFICALFSGTCPNKATLDGSSGTKRIEA